MEDPLRTVALHAYLGSPHYRVLDNVMGSRPWREAVRDSKGAYLAEHLLNRIMLHSTASTLSINPDFTSTADLPNWNKAEFPNRGAAHLPQYVNHLSKGGKLYARSYSGDDERVWMLTDVATATNLVGNANQARTNSLREAWALLPRKQKLIQRPKLAPWAKEIIITKLAAFKYGGNPGSQPTGRIRPDGPGSRVPDVLDIENYNVTFADFT